MKKIIFILLALFILLNCSSNKIKVYIDDESISTKGIEAWNKNIKYVDTTGVGDLFYQPDLLIYLKPFKDNLTFGYTFLNQTPTLIYIYYTNDVVIAHEFGHFLGLEHSTDPRSIMYPSLDNLNKPLSWFKEFSNE